MKRKVVGACACSTWTAGHFICPSRAINNSQLSAKYIPLFGGGAGQYFAQNIIGQCLKWRQTLGKKFQDGKKNQHSPPFEGTHLIKTYAPIRLRCYWRGMYRFVHSVCTFMLQVSILEEFTKNDHWTAPVTALSFQTFWSHQHWFVWPPSIHLWRQPLGHCNCWNCFATRGHSTWGRFIRPLQTCSLPGSALQATQRLQMHVPPWSHRSPPLWMQCCELDNQRVHPQTNGMTKHFNCTLADVLFM